MLVHFHYKHDVLKAFEKSCREGRSVRQAFEVLKLPDINRLHKVFYGELPIPLSVCTKVGLRKVMEGVTTVGYITDTPEIEWQKLWQNL